MPTRPGATASVAVGLHSLIGMDDGPAPCPVHGSILLQPPDAAR
jgi:hypothetical protein